MRPNCQAAEVVCADESSCQTNQLHHSLAVNLNARPGDGKAQMLGENTICSSNDEACQNVIVKGKYTMHMEVKTDQSNTVLLIAT